VSLALRDPLDLADVMASRVRLDRKDFKVPRDFKVPPDLKVLRESAEAMVAMDCLDHKDLKVLRGRLEPLESLVPWARWVPLGHRD
jgi:hypothetical protein